MSSSVLNRLTARWYWPLLVVAVAAAVVLVVIGLVEGWGYWTGVFFILAVTVLAIVGVALGLQAYRSRS